MEKFPTRYPLDWPNSWKRTAQRKSGTFNKNGRYLTVSDGVQRVLDELDRLGVKETDVVISSNVKLRLDGLPRSGEPKPTDPGVCVYWQKAGQPMRCMAIDRYDEVPDNLAAVAATLEAMRAIERHGGAAILDRAFTGFTALPAPVVAGMKRPWNVVLGIPDGPVSRELIKQRYRELAAKNHPDLGGSHEAMAELNAARDEALGEVAA